MWRGFLLMPRGCTKHVSKAPVLSAAAAVIETQVCKWWAVAVLAWSTSWHHHHRHQSTYPHLALIINYCFLFCRFIVIIITFTLKALDYIQNESINCFLPHFQAIMGEIQYPGGSLIVYLSRKARVSALMELGKGALLKPQISLRWGWPWGLNPPWATPEVPPGRKTKGVPFLRWEMKWLMAAAQPLMSACLCQTTPLLPLLTGTVL